MNNGTGNALANLLFVAVLHRVAGDVVKDLTLFERTLWRLGFLIKVAHFIAFLFSTLLILQCEGPYNQIYLDGGEISIPNLCHNIIFDDLVKISNILSQHNLGKQYCDCMQHSTISSTKHQLT
jgi:hypothetical protein